MNGTTLNTNSYISLGLVPLIIGATSWILIAINSVDTKAEKARDVAVATIAKVELMDVGGTRGAVEVSRASIERITKLEEATNKLIPDVAQIKTDMSWIADWVKEQRRKDENKH